jgi:hypothetical protein
VKVFGDGTDIIGGQCEFWHGRKAGITASTQDDRPNQFARLIRQNHRRPEQIGPALIAATKVGAMAQPAVGSVESITACDYCGIARWALLRGKGCRWIADARSGGGWGSTTSIPPSLGGNPGSKPHEENQDPCNPVKSTPQQSHQSPRRSVNDSETRNDSVLSAREATVVGAGYDRPYPTLHFVFRRITLTDLAGSSCVNFVPALRIVIGFGTTFMGSPTVLIAPGSPVIISPDASFRMFGTPSKLICSICEFAWMLTSLRITSPVGVSRVALT